jgi:hypothetical protein
MFVLFASYYFLAIFYVACTDQNKSITDIQKEELTRKELGEIGRSVQRFYLSRGQRKIRLRLEYAKVIPKVLTIAHPSASVKNTAQNDNNQNSDATNYGDI